MRLAIYALFFSSILSQSTQPFYKDEAQREVFIKYAGIISTVFSPAEINQNKNILITSYLMKGDEGVSISPVFSGKINISWNLSITARTSAFSNDKRAIHSYGWGISLKPGQPEDNSPWSFHYNSGSFKSYNVISISSASTSIIHRLSSKRLNLFFGYTANTLRGIDYTSNDYNISKKFDKNHTYFSLGTMIDFKGIQLFPSFVYGGDYKMLSFGLQNQF